MVIYNGSMRRAGVLLRLLVVVLVGLAPLTASASSSRQVPVASGPRHPLRGDAWKSDPQSVAQRVADAINARDWQALNEV